MAWDRKIRSNLPVSEQANCCGRHAHKSSFGPMSGMSLLSKTMRPGSTNIAAFILCAIAGRLHL